MTSKTEEVVEDIITRCKAGYPVIWVKTEEYARAIEILQTRFEEENKINKKIINEKFQDEKKAPINLKNKNIFHWDAINGLVNITNQNSNCERVYPFSPKQGTLAIEPPAFTHVLSWANQLQGGETIPENSVVLVNGFHNLLAACPATEHGKMRQAILQIIQPSIKKVEGVQKKGLREGDEYRTVILVGPKPEHPVLSPDVMTYLEIVNLPRPNEEEINEMIEIQLGDEKTPQGEKVTKNKELVAQCAQELKGTTNFQGQNATAYTYIKKKMLDPSTLRKQYKGIMELHPALSIAEYKETWEDLVGFENYKRFISALFHPNQKKKDIKGVLFIGTSGTGKSHAAKATGQHLGLKTIFCNLGRVFNKYVGDSEANTESLFRSIDACGRSIVYIDEIEKGLGGMGKGHGGDGGVSDRVMQQTLTWMNDHDQGAFLIATANDPHILPTELLREGRWDCIFNVPPPNFKQRESLAELYSNKAEIVADKKEIAARTEGWVGAEIKGLMEKAEVFKLGCKSDKEALEIAFSYVKPMCIADKDRFERRIEESKAQGVSVNEENNNNLNLSMLDINTDMDINTHAEQKIISSTKRRKRGLN